MKPYFDQLKLWWEKLKPMERRWAVFIGMVMFILVNYFFIWSHFGDWGRNRVRLQNAERTNELYQAEVSRKTEYSRKLAELQADGSSVVPEDQAIDFVHFYNSRAVSNQVTVNSQGQLQTSTNEFFLEQQMGISVQGYETNLVRFLYSLGAGNSMMRVRSMNLHPEPNHQMLNAGLTLVASYQKKPPERAKTAASPAPATAATPAPGKPRTTRPPTAPVAKAAPPVTPNGKGPPPFNSTLPPTARFDPSTNRLNGFLARRLHTNRLANVTAP